MQDKSKDIIQSWQSTHEVISSKFGALPTIKEPPNSIALVLNLQHMDVKSTLEKLQGASPEEIKAHKALRSTFVIVKMLYPGFTFIDLDNEKDSKFAKNKSTGVKGAKDKLGHFDEGNSDNVILHTYKIESKKGVYRASKRLEDCIALSPGMVINGMIWGEKIPNVFKGQTDDIHCFQLAVVQLKIMSNSASGAAESGRMLEIKSFASLDPLSYSPSSFKLLKTENVLGSSIQGASVIRDRILDGSLVSEQNKQHLNQDLIKGALSTSVNILAVKPNPSHGTIAMAADGKIKLFLHQPIGDVKAYAINLAFDRQAHHCPEDGLNDEWMAKLLNVCMMVGAVEIIVVIDSYKNKDILEADLVLDGYARIDISAIHKSLIACRESEQLQQISEPKKTALLSVFETQGIQNAGKNIFAFIGCATELDILVDMRKMTNKKDSSQQIHSALVHHDADWKKGHMFYAFFEGKSVLSAIIPLAESGVAFFSERAKRGLESDMQFADMIKDVEFEDEAEGSATATTSTLTADEEAKPTSSKKKQKTTSSQ
jgi:hypothetical protein